MPHLHCHLLRQLQLLHLLFPLLHLLLQLSEMWMITGRKDMVQHLVDSLGPQQVSQLIDYI